MELKTKRFIAREGLIFVPLILISAIFFVVQYMTPPYEIAPWDYYHPCKRFLYQKPYRAVGLLFAFAYPAYWLVRFVLWSIKTIRTEESLSQPVASPNESPEVDTKLSNAGAIDLKNLVRDAEQHQKSGKSDDAIRLLLRGLEQAPNYTSARLALGKIYFKREMSKEAEAEFVRVIKTNPDNLLALNNLADIYLKMDDNENATKTFQSILKFNPKHEKALSYLKGFVGAKTGEATNTKASAESHDSKYNHKEWIKVTSSASRKQEFGRLSLCFGAIILLVVYTDIVFLLGENTSIRFFYFVPAGVCLLCIYSWFVAYKCTKIYPAPTRAIGQLWLSFTFFGVFYAQKHQQQIKSAFEAGNNSIEKYAYSYAQYKAEENISSIMALCLLLSYIILKIMEKRNAKKRII